MHKYAKTIYTTSATLYSCDTAGSTVAVIPGLEVLSARAPKTLSNQGRTAHRYLRPTRVRRKTQPDDG